MQQLLIGN
uniref:Uncharacterized protein n=1 Tax=Arundo donax TaxID=35708 RepID=A0A0A9HXJ9_ARUDO